MSMTTQSAQNTQNQGTEVDTQLTGVVASGFAGTAVTAVKPASQQEAPKTSYQQE